ncbi:transposase family protein [Phytohabitans sp. ZYX-F-186]|uniref:Transposase family protein n=1 Tax=Phytohabitans maris TaxID=3071409 RepID=A0ABU0ZHP7_9ACTN|nr:transposase family protein [Phytohabitans sp. ZYX-F-186]MDQ7906584.1 transposase family protein [Phytohabitans sp. ZYX-F-186]
MTTNPDPDSPELVYQVRLPLSTQTVQQVRQAITTYRKQVRSRWRKLPDGQAALLVLAYLRHDQRLRDLAGGNSISASTLHRWAQQALTVLAAQAPRLPRALAAAVRAGHEYVLLDATLIRTRRRNGRRKRADFNGKHRHHGLLFTALVDPVGNLLWISAAKAGRTNDATAARHQHITAALRQAGLGCIADMAYSALDDNPNQPTIITGRRPHPRRLLTRTQTQINAMIARDRAVNEHPFAYLKNWRILTKLRIKPDPARATTLLRALLVLTQIENPR